MFVETDLFPLAPAGKEYVWGQKHKPEKKERKVCNCEDRLPFFFWYNRVTGNDNSLEKRVNSLLRLPSQSIIIIITGLYSGLSQISPGRVHFILEFKRERQRKREWETERNRDRETERDRDRERQRQRERETERQRHRETETDRDRDRNRRRRRWRRRRRNKQISKHPILTYTHLSSNITPIPPPPPPPPPPTPRQYRAQTLFIVCDIDTHRINSMLILYRLAFCLQDFYSIKTTVNGLLALLLMNAVLCMIIVVPWHIC